MGRNLLSARIEMDSRYGKMHGYHRSHIRSRKKACDPCVELLEGEIVEGEYHVRTAQIHVEEVEASSIEVGATRTSALDIVAPAAAMVSESLPGLLYFLLGDLRHDLRVVLRDLNDLGQHTGTAILEHSRLFTCFGESRQA